MALSKKARNQALVISCSCCAHNALFKSEGQSQFPARIRRLYVQPVVGWAADDVLIAAEIIFLFDLG
jgi:hypothetical protein